MPKLPHLSGAAIIRALEHLGFEQVRSAGSHVFMRNGARTCVVPLHKEVKIGTLAGVLRQGSIESGEFLRAL